jgi:hypothetical protein
VAASPQTPEVTQAARRWNQPPAAFGAGHCEGGEDCCSRAGRGWPRAIGLPLHILPAVRRLLGGPGEGRRRGPLRDRAIAGGMTSRRTA